MLLAAVAAVASLVACRPVVQSSSSTEVLSKPANVTGRDIGISALVGSTVTWLFGDTVFNPRSCDGTHLRHGTGALGSLSDITALSEPLDACGAPFELVTPQVPTDASGRTAFWPDSIIPNGEEAIVFYQRVLVSGGNPTTFTVVENSVAEMAEGSTTLDRSREVVLFDASEPPFSSGSLVSDGYIYLYTTEVLVNPTYRVARVPFDSYRSRSAYTFWDGSGWSSDVSSAQPIVLGGAGAESSGGMAGLTVSWNPHLRKFLMVHSHADGLDVLLRTANRPEGPWSAPTHLDVPDSRPNSYGNYSAREHTEFRSPDGRTIVITYHRSTGWLTGEVRVVRITFA